MIFITISFARSKVTEDNTGKSFRRPITGDLQAGQVSYDRLDADPPEEVTIGDGDSVTGSTATTCLQSYNLVQGTMPILNLL